MSYLNFFLHLLFLLLVRGSYARIVSMASAELIQSVCKTNDDPTTCDNLLNSVAATKTANLTGLGRISLRLAQARVKEATEDIAFMNETTTDPQLRNILGVCNTWYGLSRLWLVGAVEALDSTSYNVMHDLSWNAGEGAMNCDAQVTAYPGHPLKNVNTLAYRVCQIATRISDLLLNGGGGHA